MAERARAAGVAYGRGGPAGGSGGPGEGGGPPNLGRIIGGSGAAIALVVGGLALNSALFNGMTECVMCKHFADAIYSGIT